MSETGVRVRPTMRRWLIAAVFLAAGVVIASAWVLRDTEPPIVDAERAVGQDDVGDRDTPDADAAGPVDDPLAEADGGDATDLTGTWEIDTSRPFDRDAGTGSFIGYRVEEELAGIGAQTAVGRSPEVDGTVTIDGTTVVEARVHADLGAFESDDSRRDDRVRSTLGADATATFDLAEPIELGEIPPVGEVVELSTAGTLTILERAREVVVDLQAVVTRDDLVVTGSVAIVFADFDLSPPTAPIVLSVSDGAILEWQLFLARDV